MSSRLAQWWRGLTGAPAATPAPAAPGKAPVFGGAAAADAPPPPQPYGAAQKKAGGHDPLRFATNGALEARLDAHLGDEEAWAIYADWLQTAGDGRGELVALMAQGLDADAAHWADRHHDALFGAVARSTSVRPFTRYRPPAGPADPIRVRRTEPMGPPDLIRGVQWDHGFVATAAIDPEGDAALTKAFLRLPICRFLRAIGFGAAPNAPESFDRVIAAVREAAPASLKQLVIGDFVYPEECEMSWAQLGDLSAAWRLKQIEALSICAGTANLGAIDGAHLVAFSRESGSLPRDELTALLAPAWPRLRRFELWTGSDEYGGDCTLADLAPLLSGEKFPALTWLALKNSLLTDAFVEALASAPLLKQLTALDLSMGTLGRDGVAALVRHAAAYRHLVHLDVGDNFIPEDDRAALREALPQVVGLDDQDKSNDVDEDAPDRRFVSVSE